jgi:hypothetical protein
MPIAKLKYLVANDDLASGNFAPWLKRKGVPNQCLLQWNNTPHHPKLWLYAAVVLLMMDANSTRNMYS